MTVEPVIGNIKQNLKFREFLLKGLDNVKIEMNLVSIAHNLAKIHRMMRENKGNIGRNSGIFNFFRNICALGIIGNHINNRNLNR